MELVENVLLFLHFVGLASLLGGFLVQIRSSPRVVNSAMFHGALTQLVTGILLVGVAEMGGGEVNHAKVGAKLVVLLVITGLVIANRKKDQVSTAVWGAIGALTLLDVGIAVFWVTG